MVEPQLLEPHLPRGTELDFHHGKAFLSIVGFLFLDTRLMGLPIPRHRDFEEVNLRFYVRRKNLDGWRRGVVFIREFVPRSAIAIVARVFYGEPYRALPMRHDFVPDGDRFSVTYQWRRGSKWETLAMSGVGEPKNLVPGSQEEFIAEHYWGYTADRARLSEYRVEHARWRYWPAQTWKLEADVSALYGPQFVETFSLPPVSAFIAEGSAVEVRRRTRELADQQSDNSPS